MVLVFKTNVNKVSQINIVETYLNQNMKILKWNFDLEDVDKILRIETNYKISDEIIQMMNGLNFECIELE